MNILERFLSYVAFDTQSREDKDSFPSTEGQWRLLTHLAEELRDMGVTDVRQDKKYGYVYGVIPSNCLGKVIPAVGFIAHVDTSDAMSGADIKPRLIENYDGKDIVLNEEQGIVTRILDFPAMKSLVGKHILVTDGTTLLGADDKAGVTEIMEMVSFVMSHPDFLHGNICIAFTPDEEIGRGVDYFSIPDFGADYAYTVDGGRLGEISCENFNAASAKVTFYGRSVHPGDAKGKMIHAVLLAQEFERLLPEKEKPQFTEEREGFYHIISLHGDCEKAVCNYIIREHDLDLFEQRKEFFANCVEKLNKKMEYEVAHLEMEDSYYNMAGIIARHPRVMEHAKNAMIKLGIEPRVTPIRGGTDGARLSFSGLPCPNLCTGGGNFHGKHEYVCLEEMEQTIKLLLGILTEYANE